MSGDIPTDATKAVMAQALRGKFAGDALAEALGHLEFLWFSGAAGRYSDALHRAVWPVLVDVCAATRTTPEQVPRMLRAIATEGLRYLPLPV